jgi:hypothetical protein
VFFPPEFFPPTGWAARATMPSASRRRKAGMKRDTTPTPHAERAPDDGQVRALPAVRTSAAELEWCGRAGGYWRPLRAGEGTGRGAEAGRRWTSTYAGAPACPRADSLSSGSRRRAECRPRRLAGRRYRIWAARSRRHHSGMPWSSRPPPWGGTAGGRRAGPVSWFRSARRLPVRSVVWCGVGWGGGVHHSACVARPPGRMRRSVACTAPMPAVVCVWLALLCVADSAWGLN